jgi:spore maturation protein SpmB
MRFPPFLPTLRGGLHKGHRQYWKILKIVLPVFFVMTVLKLVPIGGAPLIPRLAGYLKPLMGFIGLPGEAALAILLGWSINIYACVSAMAAGGYSVPQATAMGLIVGIAHNFFVETAILYKLKANGLLLTLFRIVAGLSAGAAYLFFTGRGAAHGGAPGGLPPPGWVEQLLSPLLDLLHQRLLPLPAELLGGSFKLCLNIYWIILLVFLAVEFLRESGGLQLLLKLARPLLWLLGMEEAAALPWLAGFLFGLVYGAGLMLQAAEEKPLPPDQVLKVAVFCILCHAVIEDTWLFKPVGASLIWILIIRLGLAFGVGAILGRWRPSAGAP